MIFNAGVFSYLLTFNFSISLLAMVQPRPDDAADHNATSSEQPDFGPRYAWSTYEQSLVVGAYFYGNVLFSVPLGMVVQRFGRAKAAILWTFVLCIVLSALSPLAAGLSIGCMFAVRFVMGSLHAFLYPSYTHLLVRWAPTAELGLFTIALIGSNMGTVLTWSLTGLIVESLGWAASFYISAAIAAVFTLSWLWLVYDSPDGHPRISREERELIATSQHDVSADGGKGWPPMASMARSVPFWALFIMQFGNSWGTFFVLTAVPKFLNEILGFQIASTGLLSSLPNICRTLFAFLFGYLAKILQARYPAVSLTVWRKVYSLFSHVLPGLLLLAMPYYVEQPYVCIDLMTISYGLNGAVTVVTICNYHDLSPNYATTLNSIINGLSKSAGFLSPMVVAFFTQEKNTIDEWHSIFIVGAAVYIVPAIVFAIGGSGQVQKWNEPNKAKVETATAVTVEKLA